MFSCFPRNMFLLFVRWLSSFFENRATCTCKETEKRLVRIESDILNLYQENTFLRNRLQTVETLMAARSTIPLPISLAPPIHQPSDVVIDIDVEPQVTYRTLVQSVLLRDSDSSSEESGVSSDWEDDFSDIS